MAFLHIGIDDTDSPRWGCTTYVVAVLVERLTRLGVSFFDYPNLVRLNPNVPWKTRGNGALCLRIECDKGAVKTVKETVLEAVEEFSDFEYAGTDPGVVFFYGKIIPKDVREFARSAIQGVVTLDDALELVKGFGAEAAGYKGGRGVIGALAAVGETLHGDHTFELIAYRLPENCGTKRCVDVVSVRQMDEATAPYTFNSFDVESGRVLITPRGPDPIFFGVRGENPSIVRRAFEMIRVDEPIERRVVFRTNQGTDAHLREIGSIGDVQPFHPVVVKGVVASVPRIVPRRHVIFSIQDDTAEIDCAAYEPTGGLRKAAIKLVVGDEIEAYGGVRPASETLPMTINLEKIRIMKLATKVLLHNPKCPDCGKTLSSMGNGFKSNQLAKTRTIEQRGLEERIYITSPHSQRHLTKPFRRYGQEKTPNRLQPRMIREWHYEHLFF